MEIGKRPTTAEQDEGYEGDDLTPGGFPPAPFYSAVRTAPDSRSVAAAAFPFAS
jgi:hypothetical protein